MTIETQPAVWRQSACILCRDPTRSVVEPMLDAVAALADPAPPGADDEFPLVLTAGERRSFTANVILRGPAWRKRDGLGALRASTADAARLGMTDGDRARLTTTRGAAAVVVEISPTMLAGHISHRCDPIAGTPYHKHVPARLEPLPLLETRA